MDLDSLYPDPDTGLDPAFQVNLDKDPAPGFWWKKIQLKIFLYIFFWSEISIYLNSIKDVQGTGEAFNPQQRTSSTSKIWNLSPFFYVCGSFLPLLDPDPNPDCESGYGFRDPLNPDPIWIRIHNTAANASDWRQDFQHGGAGRHPPPHSQQRQVLSRLLRAQQGGRGGSAAGGSSCRRWGGGRGTPRSLTTFRGCLRTGLSFQAELSWSFFGP